MIKKRINFFESEEGVLAMNVLRGMMVDETFNTDSSFSSNADSYPDNLITFVDKHMTYLNTHPNIDPRQYVSNLRLMTRVSSHKTGGRMTFRNK